MNRQSKQFTKSVGASEAASESIDYDSYAGGSYRAPSGTGVTFTWYGSIDGETFYAAYDADGAAVTQTVTSDRIYPIPDALYGCKAIKAVGSEAVDDVEFTLKT
jgi:hypothetical protein